MVNKVLKPSYGNRPAAALVQLLISSLSWRAVRSNDLFGATLFPRCFRWVSNRYNHTPGLCRMFEELVCLCNVMERKPFSNVKSLPPCCKCLINRARGVKLCLGRYIVTADKEHSGVAKDQLP